MIYTLLLIIGLLGLIAQAMLGAAGGHGGGHGGHSHVGHIGHGHAGHLSHGGHTANGQHAAQSHGHGHGQHTNQSQGREPSPLWALLSPLTLFSLCLGIGATGLLLHPFHLVMMAELSAAIAGGVVFYALGVRPLSGFIFQFASKPIRGLEAAISKPAEALSRFDARGQGMVRLTVDGQLVRILATLEPEDVQAGIAILPGDTLIVTSVDTRTNTCHVIRS